MLLLGAWALGSFGFCETAQSDPIAETKIIALEQELALAVAGTSEVDIRRACKRVARKTSALLEASPSAPNRFHVLGIQFRCQKRLAGLEMTARNREALLETCSSLSRAPDEYAKLRLDADLLLSERDLAEAGADVRERAEALGEIIGKYRGTRAERRCLTIAEIVATKLQAFDLATEIRKELAGSSLGGDHEVIAFRWQSRSTDRLDAVFTGTYEGVDRESVTFPTDRLGHQYLVIFWSRDAEGCEVFLSRIREQQERFPGRFELYSFNLDELPDAGQGILVKAGVKGVALHLPGGKANPACRAYALADPGAILVNSQGHAFLQWGRRLPWPGLEPARGNEPPKPGPGLGMWLDDERYVAQLRSLFIGDFLVAEAGASPTGGARQASEAVPSRSARVPEETRREMQSCFTLPPFRYRLAREVELDGYRRLEKLCADAVRKHSAAPDLWVVRNRRIIALMGMWNLAGEPEYLEEAVKEAKVVLATEMTRGADVVARFCLAKEALRGGDADPRVVVRDFLDAVGGDRAPAKALAAAAVLAIEANEEAAYRKIRQRLLGFNEGGYPGLWPVLSFLRDRHHDYRLFWGNPGRWGVSREQRYKVRYLISGLGASRGPDRVLEGTLKGLDGEELTIPRDLADKVTGIIFVEPPAKESERATWAARVKDFADQFSTQDVPVTVAFLSDDLDAVNSHIEEGGGSFRAATVPGGLKNPLVRRLGILSADRIPNPFVLYGDGTIAWSISGLTYPVDMTKMDEAVSASIGINIEKVRTDRAFEALEEGEFKRALVLLGERLPPKVAADPWTADRFQGRALAYMGLNDWEAALTAIDAAIAERKRSSRHAPRLSLGEVEMHIARATVLKELGREQDSGEERAVAERGLAWLETAPDAKYPPSYARNGIPVGVYDDLLGRVRLKLERGER